MLNRRGFLGAGLAALGTAAPPQRAGGLRAGAATSNITPLLGCSLAGGMTDRIGREIHDELHVRSLVLDNGINQLAFALVDSCAVPRDIIDEAKALIAKRCGIPAAHVLVAATHTHSAPPATHLFQSIPDSKYTAWLTLRIADAVQLAHQRLRPARAGWGLGREERLLFNRRYHMKAGMVPKNPFGGDDRVKMNPGVGNPDVMKPAGPVDPEVPVLALESSEGAPIAVLASYGLHYVGDTGPGHVSADYFACWAGSMQRLAGTSFIPILANGCSGNVNNVDVLGPPRPRRPPYEHMQRVADILAAECYRVWRTMRFHETVPLEAGVEELTLGTRLPSREEVIGARRLLEEAKDRPIRDQPLVYARETVLLADYPPRVKTLVQTMRIGDLGIASFPGEAFAELGLAVKKSTPFHPAMMIELANDYRGYIPTLEAFQMGGYETWRAKSSYLEAGAAPQLVKSAISQLDRLSGRG
ncbi:MAG: hypothetical protein HYS04_18725 [Acidobacteria bacterium]|nr:hypothetical protein [Acidobacteriota bacterium]